MKTLLTILSTLFIYTSVLGQSVFEFEPKIEYSEYCLLKGNIGGKYPATMYLTQSYDFCGEGTNNRWRAMGLKGWYFYDKVKKKIPLIGSYNKSDNNNFIKLYVPQNISDTIDTASCELMGYKEIFWGTDSWNFSDLAWKISGPDSSIDANLKIVHGFSFETEALILLKIWGLEMATFDLTELSKIDVIADIQILASKKVANTFYVIFQFGHRTIPGSHGSGQCGAGWEGYLGFMQIDDSFGIEQFEFYHSESCEKYIPEDQYSYDSDFPEKGILMK